MDSLHDAIRSARMSCTPGAASFSAEWKAAGRASLREVATILRWLRTAQRLDQLPDSASPATYIREAESARDAVIRLREVLMPMLANADAAAGPSAMEYTAEVLGRRPDMDLVHLIHELSGIESIEKELEAAGLSRSELLQLLDSDELRDARLHVEQENLRIEAAGRSLRVAAPRSDVGGSRSWPGRMMGTGIAFAPGLQVEPLDDLKAEDRMRVVEMGLDLAERMFHEHKRSLEDERLPRFVGADLTAAIVLLVTFFVGLAIAILGLVVSSISCTVWAIQGGELGGQNIASYFCIGGLIAFVVGLAVAAIPFAMIWEMGGPMAAIPAVSIGFALA